jgi:hypothetical protein
MFFSFSSCFSGWFFRLAMAMVAKVCEICAQVATVFCEADATFLCAFCDALIHGTNILA